MMPKDLINAIAGMEDTKAVELARAMLNKGMDPMEIIGCCKQAMQIVGRRYENKEYFLPELIMGGEIMKKIFEVVKPKMETVRWGDDKRGKIVFGTVAGDIHDIGKDIVIFMLKVNGFEVHDLGVDVPSEKFVEKIKEVKPDIVGLSGFVTFAFDSMKETVDAIREAGYRDKVKIMIGGGSVTEDIKDFTGADAFGEDAMAAVSLAKKWVGVEHSG